MIIHIAGFTQEELIANLETENENDKKVLQLLEKLNFMKDGRIFVSKQE